MNAAWLQQQPQSKYGHQTEQENRKGSYITRTLTTNLQHAVGDEKSVKTDIKQVPATFVIEDCPYVT
jgi:hypothetical protein